jgi:hypothetical protein
VDDGIVVEVVYGSHDAILEFCLEVTRMWRRTERASLEKKPSMRLSQEPCFGVKGEFEAASGLIGEPSFGFLRDVGAVIVEDQLDRLMGRIGGIEKLRGIR